MSQENVGGKEDALQMEFIRQEYFHLQEAVEKFDEKELVIKGWSVTLSMGGIGVAFLRGASELCLLSAAAALLFWYVDALWKCFQQAFYFRIRTIEDYMHGDLKEPFVFPAIYHSWGYGWRKTSMNRVFFWSHVALPHVAVVIFGILLWILSFLGFPLFSPTQPN